MSKKPRIKKCCGTRRIKIVNNKLRACMVPKPNPAKEHIIFDTGVVMLGGIKYCPFCGIKVEVIR